jgi:acyl dehydratase
MSDVPELRVTPDKYLPFRYAGASGDFNPIHLDPELAKAVGFPGNILHGLWSMAQVARAAVDAGGGDPRSLKRLSVQFRGIGLPEQEIVISGVEKGERDGRLILDLVARQEDREIVKHVEAELEGGSHG